MIESWVMVFMICTRGCTVSHVEPYPSRSACVKNLPKAEGMFDSNKYLCVPVSKD